MFLVNVQEFVYPADFFAPPFAAHRKLPSVTHGKSEFLKICGRPRCLNRFTSRTRLPAWWTDVGSSGASGGFGQFFWPTPECSRKTQRRKYFGFHSTVPTHPTPSYISYRFLGRRVVNFGDEYRGSTQLWRVGSATILRPSERPPLGLFSPRHARPMPSGSLSSPASLRHFQNFRFAGFRPVSPSHPSAASPAGRSVSSSGE